MHSVSATEYSAEDKTGFLSILQTFFIRVTGLYRECDTVLCDTIRIIQPSLRQ